MNHRKQKQARKEVMAILSLILVVQVCGAAGAVGGHALIYGVASLVTFVANVALLIAVYNEEY